MDLLAEGLRDAAGAWRFIRRFAADYASPIGPGDGVGADVLRAAETGLGLALPVALREAYALFGRRLDLTRGQHVLLTPYQLHVDDTGRVLVFRWECQHVSEWGIALSALTEPDPPVVFRYTDDGEWHPFLDRVSVACVEMVMSEWLLGGAEYADNLELDDDALAELLRRFRPLPMPAYSLVPGPDGPPVRWFEGFGAVLCEYAETWLWAGAASGEAIAAVREALPGYWFSATNV